MARQRETFRPKSIALIIEQESTFGRHLTKGIIEYTRGHPHFEILMHEASPYTQWEHLPKARCDGVIALTYAQKQADALNQLKVPVVNVSSQMFSPPLQTVCTDNARIGQLAAMHLMEKGFERFAFVGLHPPSHDLARLAGFQKALARRGFGCEVFWVERDGRAATAGNSFDDYLNGADRPVGVMTSNDRVGIIVLNNCRRLRLAVPDRVAVIGCDNDETLCQLAYVTMTSVDPAADAIGRRAAEVLDSLMQGRKPGHSPELVPPHGIERRNSTDVRGIIDPEVGTAVRFIRDHADVFIDVSDVLGVVPMSRRALERRFDETLGHGIYEEIHIVHIERAKQLLERSDMPLTKIALSSGYHGVIRFKANFERIAGIPATEYRKRAAREPQSTHKN